MVPTAERIAFNFLPGLPLVVETQATLRSRDAGILPLRQFDGQIGFSERFVDGLHDPRDPALPDHGFDEMVRQRLYGILAGYAEGDQGGSTKATITTPCDRLGAGVVPQAAYHDYAERGESENRNQERKAERLGDRRSGHRFPADYFRTRLAGTRLHVAAWNRLVRRRRVAADPPSLTAAEDPSGDGVPVADPTVPVEAWKGEERRRDHRYRRQRDPRGQGHIATWRMMLIQVAGEVIQSTRRILLGLPRPRALSFAAQDKSALVQPGVPGPGRSAWQRINRSSRSLTTWFSMGARGFSAPLLPPSCTTPHG